MTAHISIVVHPERKSARDAAKKIIDNARTHGIEVTAGTDDAIESIGLPWSDKLPDVMVTVGGDGTIMRGASVAVPNQIPILGFNLGAVGFLAEAEPHQIDDVMSLLAAGKYSIEEHMTLEVKIPGMEPRVALNDVVFAKQERQRLVSVTLSVDGEHFHTYRADALVIATPTGSTAYSLSAGGPVVDPDIDAMVVTPVAPHSLFGRPVVFAGSTTLGCSAGSARNVGIDIDGMPVSELGDEVIVSKSDQVARFVQIDGPTFPSNLVSKLGIRDS
jgi:NAD+ kinase